MPTIVGAGSIGLALGARLARAGLPVRFVTRRRQAAEGLRAQGVCAEDLAAGTHFCEPVEADCDPAARCEEPLLLCVGLPDLAGAAAPLHASRPGRAVVSFQNDVEAEPYLASQGLQVIGGVWRQTCTRVDDRRVRFAGQGRLVVGPFGQADPDLAWRVADWLERAGFDVGRSRSIGEDKWLKLCINLMSAPNALIRREDHRSEAFVEIKARLLEEARDLLEAAGIPARSCDGRDRSLEDEIRFQRESLARGDSARTLPLYNQVWSSLRSGSPCEATAYHRRFVDMGKRLGIATPANRRVLQALEAAVRQGSGPESLCADALLA